MYDKSKLDDVEPVLDPKCTILNEPFDLTVVPDLEKDK
jgi:hypothetical protein